MGNHEHAPAPTGETKPQVPDHTQRRLPDDLDGLEGKKPDELTPEELRLMADTMPGEGPGD
jgi:hypothetical protein